MEYANYFIASEWNAVPIIKEDGDWFYSNNKTTEKRRREYFNEAELKGIYMTNYEGSMKEYENDLERYTEYKAS